MGTLSGRGPPAPLLSDVTHGEKPFSQLRRLQLKAAEPVSFCTPPSYANRKQLLIGWKKRH